VVEQIRGGSNAARQGRAPAAGTISRRPQDGSTGLSRIACSVSHSDTKPLSVGIAEMATQPVKNAKAGHGVDQAAEVLHVALTGGRQHGASAEEQEVS
jgi:hypothetical protein